MNFLNLNLNKIKRIFKRSGIPGVEIGTGYNLARVCTGLKAKEQRIIIPDSERNAHWVTFGGSRTGKTRGLTYILDQAIAADHDVIVLDPKGDASIFESMYQSAAIHDRDGQVVYVNVLLPEVSQRFNPFAWWTALEEIAEHVVAGIPPSPEPFFTEEAFKVARVAIELDAWEQRLLGRRPQFTISRLLDIFQQSWIQKHIQKAKEECRRNPDSELRGILALSSSITNLDEREFETVCSDLTNVMMRLGTGMVRNIIDTDSNLILDRLWNGQGLICYIYTGAMVVREAAYTLGRLILSMLHGFIGRVYAGASGGKLPRVLEVHVDEASSALYPGIEDLLNKAGGANVWLHMLTQSIADIDAHIGQERRQVILDSCAVKLFYRCGDSSKTGQCVAELAGEAPTLGIMSSTSDSVGYGSRIAAEKMKMLDPSSVTKLHPRHFLAFIANHGNYLGTFRDVPAPVPHFSDLRYIPEDMQEPSS